MTSGADVEKNFGGGFEKIRIITIKYLKIWHPRAYYLCAPPPEKNK
jgi:hypothetical protein